MESHHISPPPKPMTKSFHQPRRSGGGREQADHRAGRTDVEHEVIGIAGVGGVVGVAGISGRKKSSSPLSTCGCGRG